MQPKSHKERPFVVWLGRPRHDGGEYLSDFCNQFDYAVRGLRCVKRQLEIIG